MPLTDGPYQHDKKVTRRAIYQCGSCGHFSANLYDHPRFADYYASLSDDYHRCHDTDQSRYRHILRILCRQPVSRVLDIGCGTGTFLTMLPPEIERFGIEPSAAAADLARAKGVRIVRYDDLAGPELQNTFDVVTAIDVVEHATDLREFRRQLTTALRPGGTAILLTGDAGSRSARFLGRYWYYLNYAEHITIFSSRSMRTWLQPDFHGIKLMKTSHKSLRQVWLFMIRAWLLFPVKCLLRKLLRVRYTVLVLPGDHMLVCAIRNQPLARRIGTGLNVH